MKAAALVSLFALGCGLPSTAPTIKPTTSPTTAPAPKPTAEEVKTEEFRKAVAVYLTEARAGIKLLSAGPSLAGIEAVRIKIQELYSHLPPVPSRFAKAERMTDRLHAIAYNFGLLSDAVHFAVEKNISDHPSVIEKLVEGVGKTEAACKEVEALLW
jgi:hypothetical protein